MSKAKILILGPVNSGKTKISNYLAGISDKTLPSEIRPTQGARILEIESNLKINNNEVHVDVQFWDCSGDEKFSACWPAIRRNTNGIIFAYADNDPIAVRKLDIFYSYFVSQLNFSHKNCIVFCHRWENEDNETTSIARISSTFSRISQTTVNAETNGEKLKQDFQQFLTTVVSNM